MSERDLWAKVLFMAVNDATARIAPSAYRHGAGSVRELERDEARNWLVRGGAWFRQVCEFCDIDPDAAHAWALDAEAEGWPRTSINRARWLLARDGRKPDLGEAA